jgi:hypothetical protein
MPPKSGEKDRLARVFATVGGRQGTHAGGGGIVRLVTVRKRIRGRFASHPPDWARIMAVRCSRATNRAIVPESGVEFGVIVP